MILTIANQKGGVGKTTTAANVGWLLAAEHEKTVALLDFNAQQAGLRSILAYEPVGATLCDWLCDPKVALERVACPVADRLWLLEGSEDLATRGRRHLESGLERLSARLHASLSAFDVWLIDTPPEIGELALAALYAASHVLVVTETLAQSVRGLVQLTATVERLGSGEEGPALVGILPTFYESQPLHHREALRVLHELYPGMVLQPIRKSIVVADAETQRLPIVAAYPSHPCSQAYRDITREILGRTGD